VDLPGNRADRDAGGLAPLDDRDRAPSRAEPDDLRQPWLLYAAVRLLFLPLAALVLLRPFVQDPLVLGVCVVLAAMPGATNAALFAEEYGVNPELASQSVFITTLFCIVTIPWIAGLVT
jgi:predicted permease